MPYHPGQPAMQLMHHPHAQATSRTKASEFLANALPEAPEAHSVMATEAELDADAGKSPHLMTIGALANAAKVTVRALRYYEEMDLIAPIKRSDGRYRLYHPRTLKRIQAILALQALNYTLEEVIGMLGKHSEAFAMQTRTERLAATRRSLMIQADGLDEKLALLQAMRSSVSARLNVLSQVCSPCAEVLPGAQCDAECTHRNVHLD
ncbi:MAG: MerR family transcriptional regulator [Vampirovibrionales bacterium]|nr:MerR family transcriptional regulator [Vampirovibrionales bacterium]